MMEPRQELTMETKMTDYDYEAIAAGMKLIQKASRAIESRRYGFDDKPGADWHVKESVSGYEGTPTYVGSHGKAALYATEDGTAYEVNVYSYAGKLAHRVTRKTMDAAFKIGQTLANEAQPEPKSVPVVEEQPEQEATDVVADERSSDVATVVEPTPATVDASYTPCPVLAEPGNMHFMTVHCVECNARRMARMTPDTVEGWYHYGNFSQDEYEAYMHAWATSAVRHTAGGWAQEPTDPKVMAIVAAIRRHAGIPAPLELTA